MSLHSTENAVSRQLDSLAGAELSSAEFSGVLLNSLSPGTYPAGREVVFVCTYGPSPFSCSFNLP